MASDPPEHVEFNETDPSAIAPFFGELRAAGGGWINLEPGYDSDDAPPPRSLLAQVFSARGPQIPLCTWVPPHTVGVHHGAGPRARETLQARGVDIPAGWRVVQDHSRRGLVVEVPDSAEPVAIVEWLIEAGTALCPIQLSGWWRAAVHRRRRPTSS